MTDLMLSYCADDFTGATDALEFLSRAGLRTVLFIEPPTLAKLSRFPGVRAVGVAGMTRTMAPDAIESALRPALSALRELGAPHVHYKVCSTFDSSPTIGSIGRAIDVARTIFAAPFVPLVVGAPALGRYCLFGNLFARMGIGSAGAVFRLDRHPSMSRHPITPADEADLRVHLARQTATPIGLVDVLDLELPVEDRRKALDKLLADNNEIVLFDVLHDEHLARIGALIDTHASRANQLFSVGSSGVEVALGMHWAAEGMAAPVEKWEDAGPAAPLLVASGSCSPVTSGQIARAIDDGFVEVKLAPQSGASADGVKQAAQQTTKHLKARRSVVIHTGPHADRSALEATALGNSVGQAVRLALEQISIPRICFAGGDTSSYAARSLGIEALEMIAPLTPGAPLCRAWAPGSPADGMEFVFKGGQVGAPDYFGLVARGRS